MLADRRGGGPRPYDTTAAAGLHAAALVFGVGSLILLASALFLVRGTDGFYWWSVMAIALVAVAVLLVWCAQREKAKLRHSRSDMDRDRIKIVAELP